MVGFLSLAVRASAPMADDSNLQSCDPEPTCEDRCRAHVDEFLRTCIESGHDPAACAERARAALDACVKENCGLCVCPEIFDPVCGVDGKTYPNACLAGCAGVEIAHAGACGVACRCNGDCAAGSVCRDGTCQPPCTIACFVADPVCGSDGHTYTCGAQDAACHGAVVLHRGECGHTCGGDTDCPIGSLCAATRDCPDACGCASFCQACACPRIYDAVCGVDGKTYVNACEARCAHVQVAHRGACTGFTRLQ